LDISQLMNGFRAPRKCQSRKWEYGFESSGSNWA
jgi:hypothetical protein